MIAAEVEYTRPAGRVDELRSVRDDGRHPARAVTECVAPAAAGDGGNRR